MEGYEALVEFIMRVQRDIIEFDKRMDYVKKDPDLTKKPDAILQAVIELSCLIAEITACRMQIKMLMAEKGSFSMASVAKQAFEDMDNALNAYRPMTYMLTEALKVVRERYYEEAKEAKMVL